MWVSQQWAVFTEQTKNQARHSPATRLPRRGWCAGSTAPSLHPNPLPQPQLSWGLRQGLCSCQGGRHTHTHTHTHARARTHTRARAVTLVGEDGLGQGGRGGSHAGRGAAGSVTGGSSEPRILTDLREGAESAGQRKDPGEQNWTEPET